MNEFAQLKNLLLNLVEINKANGEEFCLKLLQEKLDVIQNNRTGLSAEEDEAYKQAFRNYEDLLPMLHENTFGKYVNDKPRGYPGDFVTQEMIIMGRRYNEHRYLGSSPLGQLLCSLTYAMPACAANEHRLRIIGGHILQSGKSIASIGSGSGMEYWDMDETFLSDTDILLLDMDEGALDSAWNHIRANGSISYYPANLLKFILCNQKNEVLAQRDLIYLLGLLDYFTVKHSSKIVSRLWENVIPGGKLILTNAHASNPTRLWMEYVSEWYLIYKTKDEMYQITEGLPNLESVEYLIDEFSVYQYMILRKN